MRHTVIKKKFERIDTGSLNSRITINLREIQPPVDNDVNLGEKFTKKIALWAMIETIRGLTIFDSTNTERIITHKFHIRKINSTITSEDWIEYQNNYFDIVDVENLGEESRFLTILATYRGDKAKLVNFA